MSVQTTKRRLSPASIEALKGERPIVSLTAYTTPIARLLDPHVDFLLVGDSLGMVLYGLDTTVGVTLDMMIAHGQAVMRGSNAVASSSIFLSAPIRNPRSRPSAVPRAF